jgi:hypothetical protein
MIWETRKKQIKNWKTKTKKRKREEFNKTYLGIA